MSVALRAVNRLRKQYQQVLTHMRDLNALLFSPSGSVPVWNRRYTVEPLEGRLLLSGTHYVVDSLADEILDDGALTLREAIQASNTNEAMFGDIPAGSATETDIITFDQTALSAEAGVAIGEALTITLNGEQLEITDDLEITGLGQDILTIDANIQSRVMEIVECEVFLTGLTLTGGEMTGSGGGIYKNGGDLTLLNSTVSGNAAAAGGGIFNSSGMLMLINSVVSGNSAFSIRYNGGGIYSDGDLILTNSTVAGNSLLSDYGAAGINNDGSPASLNNSIVAQNNGPDLSGNFISNSSLVSVDPGFVRNPSSGTDGEWGTDDDDYGDLRLADTSLAINLGNDALAVDGNGVTLAIDLDGSARIADGRVDIGAYEYQGVLSPARELSPIVTTLADVVDSTDGLISLREALVYGSLLAEDVTFDSSLAGGMITLNGQELYIYQSVAVNATSIGGMTIDAARQSRVIWINNGDVALTGLRLTGGLSAYNGGGIYKNRGNLILINSIVAGNVSEDVGGGIYDTDDSYHPVDSSLTLVNSTVAGNSARFGGGIYTTGIDTLMLNNSIVTLNDSNDENDIWGISTSNNSLVGVDPGFVRNPSAGVDGQWGTDDDDYGDLRLRPDSVVIDAGDNALAVDANGDPLATDIRGAARIVGGSVDIGAYEYQDMAGDANGDEIVNLDDFIILKQNYGLASGATKAQGNFNTDERINLDDFIILKQNYGTALATTPPSAASAAVELAARLAPATTPATPATPAKTLAAPDVPAPPATTPTAPAPPASSDTADVLAATAVKPTLDPIGQLAWVSPLETLLADNFEILDIIAAQ